MFTDDHTRLREMLDTAADIVQYSAGRGRGDLDSDKLLATSLVHWIQLFGDASRLLSTALKEGHPEVPWARIQGMRHRIVHDYTQVDVDIVWQTCTADIPELIPRLGAIQREIA